MTQISKKKPVEPDWHKQLMPLAKLAGAYADAGCPAVCDFKNLCKRLKGFGVLTSWEIRGGVKIHYVAWVARDKMWSGSA